MKRTPLIGIAVAFLLLACLTAGCLQAPSASADVTAGAQASPAEEKIRLIRAAALAYLKNGWAG